MTIKTKTHATNKACVLVPKSLLGGYLTHEKVGRMSHALKHAATGGRFAVVASDAGRDGQIAFEFAFAEESDAAAADFLALVARNIGATEAWLYVREIDCISTFILDRDVLAS